MRIFRKMATAFMILGMLIFTACGSDEGGGGEAAVSFTKEGKIRTTIRESFEQSYYDKEELKQTILTEVADYNRMAGEERISVEKVEVENAVAEVEMTYARAEDYASFNQTVFFTGTPAQAEAAGYDLNVVLSSVKDENETVGKSDILAMKDVVVLITDEKQSVSLDKKALYASDNVAVSENAREIRMAGEGKELAYIIYK